MGLKCSHCAVINMPEANFCQGCGRRLSPSVEAGYSSQKDQPQSEPHVCFRCSAPLPDGAKVCEKCGLNVESLFHTQLPQPQAVNAARLAELTFFNRPPPPDPQVAAFKTYAGWFAVVLLAIVGSFSAYSWLEASNVLGRLTGGDSRESKAQVLSSQRSMAPLSVTDGPALPQGPEDGVQTVSASVGGNTVTAGSAKEGAGSAVAIEESDSGPSAVKASGHAETVPQTIPSSDMIAPEGQSEELLPAELALSQEATPVRLDEHKPAREPEIRRQKRSVAVANIEVNKQARSTPRNEVEDFFRRWKKSIKQGVTERPCTQQEIALNQCN